MSRRQGKVPRSPYLRGIPRLPDSTLAAIDGRRRQPPPGKREQIDRQIADRAQAIRRARTRYEAQTGTIVHVEPPTEPD